VLSAMQIAECTRLETPTVSKLLKRLAHAGLVRSFRGANGGYQLAREPADINLAEIVEAMEGPLAMTACSMADGQCNLEPYCNMRGTWLRINQVVESALQAMSLADVMLPETESPIPSAVTHG